MTAKAGNQPECMAASPTMISWTNAATAAKITHRMSIPMLICVNRPVARASTTAVPRNSE